MKRFQKLTIILASLALLLMLAVGVRSSVAYFTSYAEGQGGETVQLVHWEELHEDVIGTSKAIQITNPEYDPENGRPTQPVFVRARAYVGTVFEDYFDISGAGWTRSVGEDGVAWWYYDEVLRPGDTTTVLNAVLGDIPIDDEGAIIIDGVEIDQNQVNVAVVFESTLALYEYQGDGTYEPFAYWGPANIQDSGETVVEGGVQS